MPGSLNFCLIVRCTAIEIPVNGVEGLRGLHRCFCLVGHSPFVFVGIFLPLRPTSNPFYRAEYIRRQDKGFCVA